MVKRIAYFVSPHGFGHAARACAVIEAIWEINPQLEVSIFTSVPQWFFQDSLQQEFCYHSLVTDIGLVQTNPLLEDLEATLQRLDEFYPFPSQLLESTRDLVVQDNCDLVICDIAPLGVQIGKMVGLPTVLVENFTWNWIYQGYHQCQDRFARHIDYLEHLYEQVDYHILTEPYCFKNSPDLVTGPIARKSRTCAEDTKNSLGIPSGRKLVTITMGGIQEKYGALESLKSYSDAYFLIPGGRETAEYEENITFLPHRSTFFHPDLIEASDVVIGKIGYSTISEVFQSGRVFGYIPREQFRESPKLEAFIRETINSERITEQDYRSGEWVHQLDRLLSRQRQGREDPRGADQVAAFVCQLPALA